MANSKAFIYIDGYNLFFALKKNDWRKLYWLDVVKLSANFVYPGHFVNKVKYFTSRVKLPDEKRERQNTYLEALYTLNFIKIIYGRFQPNELECFGCHRKIPFSKEKKTDVNIATQMIYDAMKNTCDVQYLLTGDSDLAPAVKLIKDEFPERKIFLICPPKKNKFDRNEESDSRISRELIRLCDNHQYITEQELKDCQLPVRVYSKNKRVIICPDYWQ
ncbi:MAG: hypothetical protein B6D44_04275 [Ignavibacteriales bacterium UTCHB2]|jgi:uncharacterized LabA/DUF88 family protein|nr:MAG: hypothetical protein B6D44_04275 [Ignavibacteriales bacterium UTCHB2]